MQGMLKTHVPKSKNTTDNLGTNFDVLLVRPPAVLIFDSSFLMALAENPTTWFEDLTDVLGKFRPVLLDCVESELERLVGVQGRKRSGARLALELAHGFERLHCGNPAPDKELVERAQVEGNTVATVDAEVLAEIKQSGRKAVTLRRGRVALV